MLEFFHSINEGSGLPKKKVVIYSWNLNYQAQCLENTEISSPTKNHHKHVSARKIYRYDLSVSASLTVKTCHHNLTTCNMLVDESTDENAAFKQRIYAY